MANMRHLPTYNKSFRDHGLIFKPPKKLVCMPEHTHECHTSQYQSFHRYWLFVGYLLVIWWQFVDYLYMTNIPPPILARKVHHYDRTFAH